MDRALVVLENLRCASVSACLHMYLRDDGEDLSVPLLVLGELLSVVAFAMVLRKDGAKPDFLVVDKAILALYQLESSGWKWDKKQLSVIDSGVVVARARMRAYPKPVMAAAWNYLSKPQGAKLLA